MNKPRFLTFSLLLACSLSAPALAADGPEPMSYGPNTTNQVNQAERDRNTMHITEAGETGLQTSNRGTTDTPVNDANDPDDPVNAASGGNFWIVMPLLLLGGIGLFFAFRRPLSKTV